MFVFCLSWPFFSFTIRAGDMIFVPSKEFSVLWFCKLSGIIPWKHQLSLALRILFPQSAWTCHFLTLCVLLYIYLKFIFYFNTVTPVRSFCDCLQSATLVTTLKNLVASANLVMSLFASYSRFLMNMLRSMCPSTDPAGVLQVCNKFSLWKMTLYSYLIHLWTFDFFLLFKSIVHPCQSLYTSCAGSHSTLLSLSLSESNNTRDGMLLVTSALICYIAQPFSFSSLCFLSSSSLFSCAELEIQVFLVCFDTGPRTLRSLACTWVSTSCWSVNIKSRKCAAVISDLKN